MRVRFTTFKDRGDLLEGSRENFLNTVEEVKEYVSKGDFVFFVNIRGVSGEHSAPHQTFRQAYAKAEDIAAGGTPVQDIYISCVSQQVATSDDIDC